MFSLTLSSLREKSTDWPSRPPPSLTHSRANLSRPKCTHGVDSTGTHFLVASLLGSRAKCWGIIVRATTKVIAYTDPAFAASPGGSGVRIWDLLVVGHVLYHRANTPPSKQSNSISTCVFSSVRLSVRPSAHPSARPSVRYNVGVTKPRKHCGFRHNIPPIGDSC